MHYSIFTDTQSFCKDEDARLSRALLLASKELSESNDIGKMQEKTLHSVLKYYYEPDNSFHEIKTGRHIADIRNGDSIIEIQTGSFRPIAKKLLSLVDSGYNVTLVHPLARVKKIIWISEDGTISEPRLSPKKETVFDALPQLFYIWEIVGRSGFTLRLPSFVIEEYRIADGWSKDGKRGSHRENRVPKEFIETVDISSLSEYNIFLPEALPDIFTVKELGALTKLRGRKLSMALGFLKNIRSIEYCGKKGRAFLYKRCSKQNSIE